MAIILLNMFVFERKNTVFFRVLCFYLYVFFLGYQIGLKFGIFLGLKVQLNFSTPPPAFIICWEYHHWESRFSLEVGINRLCSATFEQLLTF